MSLSDEAIQTTAPELCRNRLALAKKMHRRWSIVTPHVSVRTFLFEVKTPGGLAPKLYRQMARGTQLCDVSLKCYVLLTHATHGIRACFLIEWLSRAIAYIMWNSSAAFFSNKPLLVIRSSVNNC